MKLKQYSKYKESGVPWIGKIPENWIVKKIKHFNNCIAGGTPSTDKIEYWDGDIPWLPSGLCHDNVIDREDVSKYITFEGLTNSAAKRIKKNSTLIALTGATCANIAYLTFSATANQSVVAMENDNHSNSKYLFYYMLSQREQVLINQTGGAQAGINLDDVKNIFCAFPENNEQTSIASFLDKKLLEINNITQKDQRLIDLLKEKRIALINHVVTKGLNPKAKLKDSGIEWIGKVPEGWKVDKLKHVSDIRISNIDKKSEDNEPDVLLCNYIDVYKNEFITSNIEFMKATASIGQILKLALKKNDVMITKDSEEATDIAVPALVIEDLKGVVCGYHLALIRVNQNLLYGPYLFRSFQSKKINDQFYVEASGVTRYGISTYPIANSYVCVPTKPEQIQIAEYLDKETKKIDQTIEKIEKKIELLEEFKKSLIHHVVTGKVDVRSVQ